MATLFDQHPDQRQLLLDDPGLIENAIEECLRYEAPSPVNGRRVTRDVTFHGHTVPEGASLLLLNGSANRDERHFPDADRFDVRRRIDRHLSFGYGAHFCIGAALARLEGQIALREFLKRYPTWEVDYDRAEIKSEFVPIVTAHAKYLNASPNNKVRLEGHSDERGSREYNIGLGERRAQAVRRALMLQGVTEAQITTVSYGEERPAVQGSDEAAYAKNRRVELVYGR